MGSRITGKVFRIGKPVIIRQYGDTDFITTLRAIAATMVILHHTNALAGLGWVGRNFSIASEAGVQIFFVISGFTIAKTYLSAPNYKHYLLRRLFRIVPVYYVAITVASVLVLTNYMLPVIWLTKFNGTIDLYNLAMHFSFLSFLDYRISNSIIAVEWTIPIEIFWYAVLPLIILQLTSIRKFVIIMVGILAVSFAINQIAIALIGGNAAYFRWWMPLTYAIYFIGGVIAYKIRVGTLFGTHITRPLPLLALVMFMAVTLLGAEFGLSLDWIRFLMGLSTFLMVAFFAPSKSPLANRITTFKPFLLLGSISYSLYLIHFIILMVLQAAFPGQYTHGLWTFFVVYTLTVIASTLTYYYIEAPTNTLGRRVADRCFGEPTELQKNAIYHKRNV